MPRRSPRRRRLATWGCLTVVMLLAALSCAAPLAGTLSALTALTASTRHDDDLAQAGTSADIPARMLAAYKTAARLVASRAQACRGMVWPVLAGIAKVESNHAAGRSIAANGDIRPRIYGVLLNGSGAGGNTSAFPDTDGGRWDGTAAGERAVGPFQFLPSTWEVIGQDGNGDHTADPHNANDAALGAAVYLCGNGRDLGKRAQLRAAVYQYNRSGAYVDNVLGWIDQYRAAAEGPELTDVTGKVRTVLEAALSQRGVPYSWGGGTKNGPSTGICCSPSGKSGAGIRGFDCSGLTLYAYAKAAISLPRTAAEQAARGTRIPAARGTSALRPGDLVFYAYAPGYDATIYHVGIYAGNGQMINAARPGTTVRLDPVDAMTGYAGGARLL
ncbi:NlpC/P60 family protein [Streptomyces sp. NPDC004528]|uniref:C40 family peptidase n=1 Tax=Streptomyces sp. NPDC004528 TaxID=3154550 RepID=UPI0033A52C86